MNDIRLTLSVTETNLVLQALGNLPYYQVCNLIEKVQAQANLQITHLNGNGQAEATTDKTVQHA
jgi:hypothetical protein